MQNMQETGKNKPTIRYYLSDSAMWWALLVEINSQMRRQIDKKTWHSERQKKVVLLQWMQMQAIHSESLLLSLVLEFILFETSSSGIT